jgi:hypothetical protein
MTTLRYALRMDDVGACSKAYEVYSHRLRGIGNWLFLKYMPAFRAWGPYPEMSVAQWDEVFGILRATSSRMTVAVTAAWVERDGTLVPFPEKFPLQAACLRAAVREGIIEIADHGLTHCLVGRHLPGLFSSNRRYHREFYPHLDDVYHDEHIARAQAILAGWLGKRPEVLVPPGNLYGAQTLGAARRHGITLLNAHAPQVMADGVRVLGNERVLAFHDREIVLYGAAWLKQKMAEVSDGSFVKVSEL